MLSGWQAGYLSALLLIFSSTSLSDYSKLGHEMFDNLHLLTVPLDCTQSFALSSYSVHPVSSLLNWCSAAPWDDLNWLNRSTAGIHTSVNATCARKAAPQHALLHISISKYTKPLWVRRTKERLTWCNKCMSSASGEKPHRSLVNPAVLELAPPGANLT